ncbi:iron ABC transporter permease [Curtobacterium sp. MCJR17_055]|uniref:FecCD family ABC transporter permease n=1 Tax=unclassified Curtobacterium TaxID=257496 RepID=UPI000D8F98A4|nr:MULTISPECIES: iron chelate uptake ABC transporter family permease subunit [unclassified Curtobacterium]PYY34206.1 iron ABC transporter permease [Curtobacterium sp. MCBD17_029]PYY50721.1 iron ABC transporter permease [Curtobacterium sp. MCBD17_023]PYY54057.1 iron ABC transporter permease [Curtobacterium sp. MCJR17_055]PYY59058.1 iron ABC transporter permease [Curtobacterium sp. MCPF17_015]PZE92606.1 iron ABC transporter permease [Curtobacterium sp. MCBD17_008]
MSTTPTESAPATGDAVRRRGGTARRELLVLVAALVVLLGLVLVGLGVGEIPLSPVQVLDGLLGRGDAVSDFVLGQLRGPRVLAALLVGASLGTAGAIVQSVVRNPIASPDIIGITSGASASGLVAIVLFGASGVALFGVVLVGAVAVAVLIAVLAWRRGITGNRVVLVGVGVGAVALSITGWLLTSGSVQQAGTALLWLSGSLNAVDRTVVGALLVGFVVLMVLALLQSPRLGVLSLGDEVAASLGLRPDRAKVLLLLTAVLLTAAAVATAGPVSFVALMAAPIARRLVGGGRPALGPAAAVGAVVTLGSDLVAQFALPGVTLPVGVVTGVVGAPYLLWLLARGR